MKILIEINININNVIYHWSATRLSIRFMIIIGKNLDVAVRARVRYSWSKSARTLREAFRGRTKDLGYRILDLGHSRVFLDTGS